jgi:hypothetical protein
MTSHWFRAVMPTTATTVEHWAWCRHWYGRDGRVIMTEWR